MFWILTLHKRFREEYGNGTTKLSYILNVPLRIREKPQVGIAVLCQLIT